MKLLIHGRNLELTPAIRNYTESKLERAIQNFEGFVKEADVHLSVAKNPSLPTQTAEVTIFANKTIIRAQESSENLYSSIDLVANKINRQLRRYKERNMPKHNSHGSKVALNSKEDFPSREFDIQNSLLKGKEVHLPDPGVRRKYFEMHPMNLQQAREQLDLIDHDFYLFKDESSGELQVIYKRNHGGYGVIQEKNKL
tara:strand:+ start:758 stop:1351 length:594 start_codon:yes stop_codon:yes gene_type:complete